MTDFLAIIPDANDPDDLTGAVFAPLGTLPQTITGLSTGIDLRPHVLSLSDPGPVFQAYTPAVITIDNVTQDAAGGPVSVEHTINKDDATVRGAYRKSTSPQSLASEFGSRNGPDYYDVPNVFDLRVNTQSPNVEGGPEGLLWDGQGGNPSAVFEYLPTGGDDADVASSPAFALDSRAPVSAGYTNSEIINSDVPGTTFSAPGITANAGSNRIVMLLISGKPTVAQTAPASGVFGAQAFETSIGLYVNNSDRVFTQIMLIREADIPAGSNNIDITFGQSMDQVRVELLQLVDIDQAPAYSVGDFGQPYAASFGPTIDMQSATGTMVSVGGIRIVDVANQTFTNDATELNSGITSDTVSGGILFSYGLSEPGALGNETHTYTSSNSNSGAFASIELQGAS